MEKKKVRDTIYYARQARIRNARHRFWDYILPPILFFGLFFGLWQMAEGAEKKWHSNDEDYHFKDCPLYMVYAHNDAVRKLEGYAFNLNHRTGSYGFVYNQKNEVMCAEESPFLNELVLPGLEVEDFDFTDENGSSFATARCWHIISTGKMVECDIWYNTGKLREDTPEQNQRTTEHEIGHFFGLRHNLSTKALMYRNNDGAPELHIIDIQLLMEKYGHCDYAALDTWNNRYTPVIKYEDQYLWTREEVTELGHWEVVGYGSSNCQ